MKHHLDNSSLVQILPNQLLKEGTMIIQTHSREATQNVSERSKVDAGCAALAFFVERAAYVYVAVDHRLAEAEVGSKRRSGTRMEHCSYCHSVLFDLIRFLMYSIESHLSNKPKQCILKNKIVENLVVSLY